MTCNINMLFHYSWLPVNNMIYYIIITTGSTVKKSVSKRRGGRRQHLREINNDDHSIMDLSPAKKQNTPLHRNNNKIMESH